MPRGDGLTRFNNPRDNNRELKEMVTQKIGTETVPIYLGA